MALLGQAYQISILVVRVDEATLFDSFSLELPGAGDSSLYVASLVLQLPPRGLVVERAIIEPPSHNLHKLQTSIIFNVEDKVAISIDVNFKLKCQW